MERSFIFKMSMSLEIMSDTKTTPAEKIDFDIIEGEATYLTEDGNEEI